MNMDHHVFLLLTMLSGHVLATLDRPTPARVLPFKSPLLMASHRQTLYVANRNTLYQLDLNLNIVATLVTPCSSARCSWDVPFILLTDMGEDGLLSCGVPSAGKCRLHQFKNITSHVSVEARWMTENSPAEWSLVAAPVDDGSLLVSYSSVSSTDSASTRSGLLRLRLWKNRRDGSIQLDLDIDGIDDMELVTSGNPALAMNAGFAPVNHLFVAVPIQPTSDDKFGYVITVQPSAKGAGRTTRLGRICAGSLYFTSYIEVTLQCGNSTGEAQAACFSGDSLYVAFSRSADLSGTSICNYPLAALDKTLIDAWDACRLGAGRKLWQTVPAGEENCSLYQIPNHSHCSSDDPHMGNVDAGAVSAQPMLVASDFDVTTMMSWQAHQDAPRVLLMGTRQGTLVKASLAEQSEGQPLFYSSYPLRGSGDKAVSAVQLVNDTLFIASGRGITAFPLQSCVVYGRDCDSFHSVAFGEPSLLSIDPAVSCSSGGARVLLTGENLDIGSRPSVLLAGVPCDILHANDTAVLCKTRALTDAMATSTSPVDGMTVFREGSVELKIDSWNLTLKNTTFLYTKNPHVTQVTPLRSFYSGGVLLSVQGDHLHVIREPQIVFHLQTGNPVSLKASCPTTRSDGTQLSCFVPAISTSEEGVVKALVSFIMDNVPSSQLMNAPSVMDSLTFHFYPDPQYSKFIDDNHIRPFPVDQRELVLQGSNLNSTHGIDDVLVTVGTRPCAVTRLTLTELHCLPDLVSSPVGANEAVNVTVGNLAFAIGYLRLDPPVHSSSRLQAARLPEWIVYPLTALALLVAASLVLVCCCYRRRRKREGANVASEASAINGRLLDDSGLDSGSVQESNHNSIKLPEFVKNATYTRLDDDTRDKLFTFERLINKEHLEIGDRIGQGHFGYVYRGTLLMTDNAEVCCADVAVKTLQNPETSPEDLRRFIEEGLIMRDFDHDNVLSLIGICLSDEDGPMMVLPFMSNGDLTSYLRNEGNTPTVRQLIMFGVDVARGMAYLSEAKFVHRDLAARNCMLDEHLRVKIADFGFSRDIYEREYYCLKDKQARLPVRWMAIESLTRGVYTCKTDVWSYGVLLWELMTRGVMPYADVDNWDVLRYLQSGRRMSKPDYCPDALYRLMLRCWAQDPADRPHFDQLRFDVLYVITQMEQQQCAMSNMETPLYLLEDAGYENLPEEEEEDHDESAI